ncbi:adenylate/guanylate cyclase domain-containing protein [Candidatus Nitrospira neomarina]|uniref:Adenylate/guanylate cyclase domain-containing protein n=1 Tax=Candidatus Nitrospira neomarina TaxID=3020899 RepID=A0AA96GI71_9BACT|nr:adenylate/guanylate cyclase domain-containing protein [Candidatus Nitrospira neomarina]WNM60760.1 adenylate/guanylate cyclase domain-containing protein [Candidatus Nitrospira neomarina]
MTFEEILDATMRLLESRKRITYGALKRQFSLDDEFLEDLKAELIKARRVAVDEGGEVLVWTGRDDTTPSPITERGNIPNPSREGQVTHQVRPSAQAERRQLTVMFCDLVGSTALSERLDPEDLREVIEAYQETCDHVIQGFEGTIMQFQGDGILVYFGHPIAHEDDAQRGILAALGILNELPNLNNRLWQVCDVELSLRVGIHTGLVVVGEMGKAGWLQTMALGETPNVASRIQNLAAPNTIVISEATLKLVKGFFTIHALGDYPIKGISQPINLWRVLGKSGVKSRFEAAGSGLTPLVGRENEIEGLLKGWERVKDAIGQVVLVKGEAGIGKTRLVEELKDRLRHENPMRQEYRCSPFYQNTALYPVTNLLGQWLHLEQEDAADAKLRKLERALNGPKNDHPKAEAVALLANLLSVPLDKRYLPLNLTPETQRQRTLEVLRDLLLETSPGRPGLFLVEDLHWVDPTTLDWLTMVINHAATAGVLVILTFRPDFEPPWADQPNVEKISLNRLNGIQVGAVVQGVTGGKPLPREITEQVVSRTDGVPLFVEELTKSLLESGLLRQGEHEYELVGSLPSMTIPATLQDSLMARLDRLATAKPVAQLGATLGREFSYELLHAVSPLGETTLQHELTRLEEAELVYRQGLLPQATYMFKHALIQEVAYESLLKSARREVHHHIAEVLENRFPSTAESEPELLAHHYTKAARPDRAIPYWQQAGQRALKRSANPEAISHLTQGLTLLQTLPEGPERDQKELAMQLGLSPAYMITKGWGAVEVEQCSKRAQVLSQKLGDGQSLYASTWGLCFNYFLRGQLNDSLKTAEEVFRMAYATDNPVLHVGAHHAVGYSYQYRGDFTKSREHAEKGIALFNLDQERAIVDLFQLSSTVPLHSFLGGGKWMLGYPEQGLAHIGQAVALAQTLQHPPSIAFAYGTGCFAYHSARDFEWVEHASAKVLELAEKEVFQLWDTIALTYHGWAIGMKGRIKDGIEEIEKGLEKFRLTGTRVMLPDVMTMLGELLWQAGRIEEALAALDEGIREATHSDRNEHFMEPELYRLKAEIFKQCAEVEDHPENAAQLFKDAEDSFQDALDLTRKQRARMLEIRAAVGLGRLWQRQGKPQEALQILEQLYNSFTEGFDTEDLREAHILIEELRESPCHSRIKVQAD